MGYTANVLSVAGHLVVGYHPQGFCGCDCWSDVIDVNLSFSQWIRSDSHSQLGVRSTSFGREETEPRAKLMVNLRPRQIATRQLDVQMQRKQEGHTKKPLDACDRAKHRFRCLFQAGCMLYLLHDGVNDT